MIKSFVLRIGFARFHVYFHPIFSFLFHAFKIKAGDKYTLGIRFTSDGFNRGIGGHQLPPLRHHVIYLAIYEGIVCRDVLETNTGNIEKVEQLRLFKIIYSNLSSIRFVALLVAL